MESRYKGAGYELLEQAFIPSLPWAWLVRFTLHYGITKADLSNAGHVENARIGMNLKGKDRKVLFCPLSNQSVDQASLEM